MRYLILSDMHANWDAFEVVLRRARRKRFDAVLVLGDLVGYGGAPNQVVEAVRGLGPRLYTVRGNHDKVVAGIDTGANFNQTALTAAQWTTGRLTPANLRYVRDLPQGPIQVEEGWRSATARRSTRTPTCSPTWTPGRSSPASPCR